MLPLTILGLRLMGFQRCHRLCRRWAQPGASPSPRDGELERVQDTDRLVRWAAGTGPYRNSCLARALIVWSLLRREGIETRLRLGVRKQRERFQAHAWIEYQGQAVNQDRLAQHSYVPFEQTFPLPDGLERGPWAAS